MSSKPTESDAAQRAVALEARRRELVERLQRGDAIIRDAADPEAARRFERHWLQLLREYERICDELDHLRAQGVSESVSD